MLSIGILATVLTSGRALAGPPNGGSDPEPILCVDTLDCGGLCGTQQEIDVFLRHCNNGPAGPCFTSCWNVCEHANDNSNNPHLSACTQECVYASCPADAAAQGLLHAGHADTCPVPDPEAICYMIYAPVDCAGCVYSNSCIAAAAGLNPAACTDISTPRPLDVVISD